jgi:type IV pilus assembly protein PilW
LTEILVTLAIAGVVMAGIYQVYNSHQRTYVTQLGVVEMQQNLRAAVYYLAREIRMAGFDPEDTGNFGIETAASNSLRFTTDTDEDGTVDSNEDITYSLYDAYSDGDNDLGRQVSGGSNQAIAENVDALNFVYFDANNSKLTAPVANVDDIRSIQITIVARAAYDPNFTNSTVYRNEENDVIYTAVGDEYRRRIATVRVRCRNMGL